MAEVKEKAVEQKKSIIETFLACCKKGFYTEDDVIHAISKYMEIEKDKVQIQMDTEGSPKKGGLVLKEFDNRYTIEIVCNKQ